MPLFPDPNGLIRACLQGHMGKAFGDHPTQPGAALLCVGDFASFGGDANRPAARRLAGTLSLTPGKTWLVAADAAWEKHLACWRPKGMEQTLRYGVEAKNGFSRERLLALASAVPPGFLLRGMDGGLYRKALAEAWSRDFCTQFADETDYLRRGMGVAALREGELAAGASSYVVYDGGIEIQVDTREDFRRRGLAAACCARLILNCLDRGLTPSWDAANPASLALAQKLGYTLKAPYPVWEVAF